MKKGIKTISHLFIIGSGFTKAVFPDAPLNDDLLEKIISSEPDNSLLRRIKSKYGLSNIETLLTRFDLDLITGTSCFKKEDLEKVNAKIAKYFSCFRFKNDVEWLHPFIQILSDNDVIVSLNYDCFLEGFLDYHEVWSPRGGYNIIKNMNDDSLHENQKNIQILKIHGSENFRKPSFFDNPESIYIDLEINQELFPKSGENQHLFGGMKSYSRSKINQHLLKELEPGPYIIAPSFIKQFALEIQYLLLEAIQFAKIAKNLVIIGCGLRPEDNHLWLVINNFLNDTEWKKKRIFIISPDALKKRQEIEQFWGRKIFNEENLFVLNAVFNENAILWLNEKLE
jgi:hypothetical protein